MEYLKMTLNSEKITLTKEQKNCVDYSGDNLVITGIPGSGKSIVILSRAVAINQKAIDNNKNIKILLVTFNSSLKQHFIELLKESGADYRMIDIQTIDSLAKNIYEDAFPTNFKYKIITGIQKKNWFNNCIEYLKKNNYLNNHLIKKMDTFFLEEEISWIKARNIYEKSEYIAENRSRRGGRLELDNEEKQLIWKIFINYSNYLSKNNLRDFEDYYRLMIKKNYSIPEKNKYDHVLVDEAQDIGLVKIKLIKLITKKSLTIALDRAQRLYTSSFTWEEIGMDVNNKNQKTLTKTFRSTRQIIELANCLHNKNRQTSADGCEYTDSILPEEVGPKPCIMYCKPNGQGECVANLAKKYIANKKVVAILCINKTTVDKACYWLESHNIPFERIEKSYNGHIEYTLLNPKRVKVSTIYAAKGLEFDVVIIPEFNEKKFGSEQKIKNCDVVQRESVMVHERCLLYVAMTRAKQALYLTYTGNLSNLCYQLNSKYYDSNAE